MSRLIGKQYKIDLITIINWKVFCDNFSRVHLFYSSSIVSQLEQFFLHGHWDSYPILIIIRLLGMGEQAPPFPRTLEWEF